MNKNRNLKLTKYSQKLRKEMTKEERHLWYDFIHNLPYNFNRQKIIGNYIVDFYCAEAKLVIELDGSQHYEDLAKEQDLLRDNTLNEQGILVLRYSNYDVNNNFDGVCYDILKKIKDRIK